ncbi:hypothetical protein R1sor_004733 [Riccia sorocarpa]|uniref:DNA-directed RNA polymerase III subunit RPC6 n=1 Tax=Riccia sorocarpa TaxID=122646 RepID=A0ABD3HHT0_9MARC
MAPAGPPPGGVGAAVNRLLDLCRANPNGLQQSIMEQEMKDVSLDLVTAAINALLGKGQLQLFQQGGSLVYKEAKKEESVKFKGLSSEDMLVYQCIQQSANQGIWTMDVKRKTNLQQPQITKAIKNLETRNLIKAVKSVEHKSRKVYMLFELEPSRDVTGGAFYTEQEFDVEFISVLKHQCLHFILKQGYATLETIADAVRKSGITKEELRLQDFKQILDMLVLDGEIEEEISSGVGAHVAIPADTLCYKGARSRIQESSAFTSIPCGVCPILHECTDDGVISPKTKEQPGLLEEEAGPPPQSVNLLRCTTTWSKVSLYSMIVDAVHVFTVVL